VSENEREEKRERGFEDGGSDALWELIRKLEAAGFLVKGRT